MWIFLVRFWAASTSCSLLWWRVPGSMSMGLRMKATAEMNHLLWMGLRLGSKQIHFSLGQFIDHSASVWNLPAEGEKGRLSSTRRRKRGTHLWLVPLQLRVIANHCKSLNDSKSSCPKEPSPTVTAPLARPLSVRVGRPELETRRDLPRCLRSKLQAAERHFSNKCLTSSNRCLASSNKKLLTNFNL